ncbi:MAG: DUF4430 domain-containing protein [Ruminococcus sp.]|nr:DUF4430 domain-containing protein [Candidatus Apopatosoma intestinale]
MKKLTALILVLAMVCAILCSCGEPAVKAPFEVGSDATVAEVDGHSEWAGTATANVKIVAGDTVLYCGKVTLTSDSLYASEFFKAAVEEKELSQEGLEVGFVTSIGSYVNDANTNTYWMWQYNGNNPTNFAVNDVHVFEGDYLLYSFEEVSW